ncbi:MAG: alpha/beta hydrolase [Rhizobiales bacterium]|nr:alpha/beta hydrolase [Hyphomicrobiales bacterium]
MSDPVIWCGMTRTQLDAAYNNGAAVPQGAALVEGWTTRSAKLRASQPDGMDLVYGPRPRNRIDLFRCGASRAPLLVFIHGGYWQHRRKENFSIFAEGPMARGFDVAMIGYTLAPDVTVTEIVAETHAAIRWLRAQAGRLGVGQGRLIVSGWSAGGHLTAMAIGMPEVDAGLTISGIFDLEPCRLNYLNEKLKLTEEEVRRASPINAIPDRSGPLVVTYGTAELPELQRQSQAYAEVWRAAGRDGEIVPMQGDDHFSIMEKLADPDGELTTILTRLA